MKKLLLIIVFFCCSLSVNNGQIIGTTGLTMKFFNVTGLKSVLGSIGNNLIGSITGGSVSSEDFQEYKKLYTLLKNSLCIFRKYEILAAIYGSNNDCLFNVRTQATLIKYTRSAQGIELAIASVNVLSKMLGGNDKPKFSVKELNDQLEQAIKDLNELNRSMEYDITTSVFNSLDNSYPSGQEVSQKMKGI